MEHTPTPWEKTICWPDSSSSVDVSENVICVKDNKGRVIALCGHSQQEEAEANAAFIVHACNAHDDLLAACKAFAEFQCKYQIDTKNRFPGNDYWEEKAMKVVEMTINAIAKAEE
ncbi:MAG: hypothetical protein WC373_07795 [Smithella sp.]|jgi:hypothetical protein